MLSQLAPVASISRREAALTEIRRAIVLGTLRPGEKLTEVALATSLGVSRATVREAMTQLVHDGLLIAEPYRGIRVAELDAAAIRDLAQTRMALDLLAVRGIVSDPSDGRLEELRAAWRVFEPQIFDVDPVRRNDAHLAFHRALWSAAHNVLLDQLWPVIEAHMTIALAEDQRARPDSARSQRIHAVLVEAITSRDDARIERALREHTVDSAEALLTLHHEEETTP